MTTEFSSPYLGILLLFLAATGFVVTLLVLSTILGPKSRTHTKQLPFECGSASIGSAQRQRFNVRFYLIAMLFILFDIEVIFMYPWAISLLQIGWQGFFQMLIFIAVCSVGLVYIWKKGVLNWND